MHSTTRAAYTADPLSGSPQDDTKAISAGVSQSADASKTNPTPADEGDYFIRQADLDRAALQRGRG